MSDLPVMLNVQGRRCVIVGGGKTAARRAHTLLEAGAKVTLIAPRLDETLTRRAGPSSAPDGALTLEARPYQPGDLNHAWLVVIATDNPAVNDAVAAQAKQAGALVNRADSGATDRGDVSFAAFARRGPVTLAVHTGGASAGAAAAIRDQLAQNLDPDWPRLLDAAAPYRQLIQQRFPDPADRRERLRRLTDGDAMLILKRDGLDALREHCQRATQRDKSRR